MSDDEARLRRAARLSRMPGVTLAEACKRFDVKKSALQRMRKLLTGGPALEDVVIAALSENGAHRSGELPRDLGALAGWIDYLNHDGCDAAEVRRIIARLVARGVLALDGERWTLLGEWPSA